MPTGDVVGDVVGDLARAARDIETTLSSLVGLGWHQVDHLEGRGLAPGHVIVGPAGVFAVTVTRWAGSVRVDDGVLRHNGRARSTALARCSDSAYELSLLLSTPAAMPVHPVLCFVRDEPLLASVGGVAICSTMTLRDTLTAGPARLTHAEMAHVVRQLRESLPAVGGTVTSRAGDDRATARHAQAGPRVRAAGAPAQVGPRA